YITALRVVLCDGRVIALKRGEVKAVGMHLEVPLAGGGSIALELPGYHMPHTKNTSGYYIEENMDAIDLFIGSDGTLGVITQIEIALRPLPKTIYGAICFFRTEEQAVEFVIKAREELSEIASMEFFDGDALEVLRQQKANNAAFAQLPLIEDWANSAIYIELHCDGEEQALNCLYAVGETLEQCDCKEQESWVARNKADIDKLLFFRHAVPESVNMLIDERKKKDASITKLGSDMAAPDEHLARIMKMYHADIAAKGLQSAIWGHIGNNHVHVNILPNNAEEYQMGKDLFLHWAQQITDLGGAVSAEHGVGKLKRDYLLVMYGRDVVDAMIQVKKAFDEKMLLGRDTMFELNAGDKAI
ncbi:FAD-binding oxidoreductase, partial [Clostridia bacterium OttesenSCG-928-F22]|nr:FAD-binding oxidoreductase [Clostridia bacterium OttesenSCG-928-F22]